MENGQKRKAGEGGSRDESKRHKKQWRVPRKNDSHAFQKVISPGDSGIWATCNKGKEGKCVGELRDLFAEYADLLYPEAEEGATETSKNDGTETPKDDIKAEAAIENDIDAELAELSRPRSVQLFTHIRIDVQCVVFFKTVAPVDPVVLVKRICQDAMDAPLRKRTRFVKRLSPMTLMARASQDDLKKVATDVLAPHFHRQPFEAQKFAIRPTLRNHNILSRDSIIKLVAPIVGTGHEVNLQEYDLLIVVEVYQNICGVSVVDRSFERLKRYNLAEIFDPTPSEASVAPTRAPHGRQLEGS